MNNLKASLSKGAFIILFFILAVTLTVYAQYPGTNQDTSQERNAQPEAINPLGGVVEDTEEINSRERIARESTMELMNKLNISFSQASEINDILIEHQEEIAEAKNRQTQTGSDTPEMAEDEGTGEEKDLLGGTFDLNQTLSEIDMETNEEVEDVLNEEQMNAYLLVKDEWWSDLKNKIYETEDQQNIDEEQQQNEQLEQDEQQEQQEENQQKEPQLDPNQPQPDTNQITPDIK